VLTAFTLWFAHFMACWAAVEVWPGEWPANALAWTATTLALLALRWHAVRLRAQRATGLLPGWQDRFARRATALAAVAVLFGALPSLVFLPAA
jgi:membrane protein implicated in regulation of membrane protease activity